MSYNHTEGVLLKWALMVLNEDDPGLGFKPQPLAKMQAGRGTVFVPADPEMENDVRTAAEAIGALQLFNPQAVQALKLTYCARWRKCEYYGATQRELAHVVQCSRSHFQERLKEGREWVGRYL